MSLESIKLDDIYLRNSAHRFDVFAKPTAFFQSPDHSGVNCELFLASLLSRHSWVRRGVACRLDLRISVNDERVRSSTSPLIKSLAHSLRGSAIWSGLSLSVSLSVPSKECDVDSCPNISIFINYGQTNTSSPPKSYEFEHSNLLPPEEVPCLSFERLELDMRLTTSSPMEKKYKRSYNDCEKMRDILLNQIWEFENTAGLGGRHNSTGITHKISLPRVKFSSDTITREIQPSRMYCHAQLTRSNEVYSTDFSNKYQFHEKIVQPTEDASPRLVQNSNPRYRDSYLNQIHEVTSEADSEKTKISRRYPNGQGLDQESFKADKAEMLRVENKSLKTSTLTSQNGNNDFFYQANERMLSGNLSYPLRKRFSEFSDVAYFEDNEDVQSNACQMFEATLYLAIIGRNGWAKKNIRNVKLAKPHPNKCLATFVPALFSQKFLQVYHHSSIIYIWPTDCFLQSIEFNALYLTAIAHLFSGYLRQNAQSPGLLKKLHRISGEFSLEDQNGFIPGEANESAKKMTDTLLVRLWEMMQNKLYDYAANRKLWTGMTTATSWLEEDKNSTKTCSQEVEAETEKRDWKDTIAEDSDFDDLFEEQETMLFSDDGEEGIDESETEEMLLDENAERPIKINEGLLPDNFSDDEIMLI